MVASLPQPDVVFFLEQSITELQNNIKKEGEISNRISRKITSRKLNKGTANGKVKLILSALTFH